MRTHLLNPSETIHSLVKAQDPLTPHSLLHNTAFRARSCSVTGNERNGIYRITGLSYACLTHVIFDKSRFHVPDNQIIIFFDLMGWPVNLIDDDSFDNVINQIRRHQLENIRYLRTYIMQHSVI
ncbi:hypothetical protein NPIL_593101 [Nephila pilipes]|uniref:Uncharacterized protein n=1 Tax=Nephila pilipes TaxID=299642 RepID=A0A8X6T554_NEPPI|nr:hypothetical protein NPIL_593101 [Nephila pilipes]